MMPFEKVAILGAGLLGASLAAALKSRGLCAHVSAWSRSESTRKTCKSAAWCDDVFAEISDAVKDADLIVLASTPDSIPEVAKRAAEFAKAGAIFTDLGSTKAGIALRCESIFEGKDFFYTPSHPMAGSEKSGAQNADANLFENRACFVCPTANPQADSKIKEMWQALNMCVYSASPQEHDAIVAKVSHLPQCLASALASFAADDIETFKKYAGGGFKDTSRIAKSDTAMWLAIFKENSENIDSALRRYIQILTNLADNIRGGDDVALEKILTAARNTRLEMDITHE